MIPSHIAVIMDGNGRWAKGRGLKRSEGHRQGVRTAQAIVTRCRELGVRHLTLYTFSTENWARPKDEKAVLFELLISFLNKELKSLVEEDIRLNILGELSRFPLPVREVVKHVMRKTAKCSSMVLNLALNYGSRDEILMAARDLAKQAADGRLKPEDIDAERFSNALYTAGQPDPELVIRTSGEYRLSNYLMWQIAYAELYFTDTLWPDFSGDELEAAIADFNSRQRRFGKTGDQIEDSSSST